VLWYRVVDLYSFRSCQGGTINSIQIYTCIYKVVFFICTKSQWSINITSCISISVLLDLLTILASYAQLDPMLCSTNCPALVSYPLLDPVLRNICVTDDHGYVPFITISSSFSLSSLVTEFATRVTWRVQHVEQELLAHPENPSSHPVFWVSITRSLVFCVVVCTPLFVLLYFFFCPLYCLFFDLRLLITPLISLSFSSLPIVQCWLFIY